MEKQFYENVSLKQKITLRLSLTSASPLQGTVYNFWLTFPLPFPKSEGYREGSKDDQKYETVSIWFLIKHFKTLLARKKKRQVKRDVTAVYTIINVMEELNSEWLHTVSSREKN